MKILEAGKRYGFDKVFDYVSKDPQKRGVQLVEWAENLSHGDFAPQIKTIKEVFEDENHPYHSFVMKIFQEVDKNQIKKVAYNFFMNASVLGWQTQQKYREKYNCNVPWAILLDPTSACNLKCTGCWAAEYGYKQNLSYDEIDSIITQGKELGTYMYIYTGGEPLVRKDDLIKLCEKHNDCVFLSFTNATLIDEDFVDEMQRVGNFI
ncbi:MAG: radical SAM protein, partial [Finegoldia magna]|nr:radical SAM protein [Finegoldia magna]